MSYMCHEKCLLAFSESQHILHAAVPFLKRSLPIIISPQFNTKSQILQKPIKISCFTSFSLPIFSAGHQPYKSYFAWLKFGITPLLSVTDLKELKLHTVISEAIKPLQLVG